MHRDGVRDARDARPDNSIAEFQRDAATFVARLVADRGLIGAASYPHALADVLHQLARPRDDP